MPVALSETDKQARLAETKPCKYCGTNFVFWEILSNGDIKQNLSKYCSPTCRSSIRSSIQPGRRFGRWVVISINVEKRYSRWLCKCDCGKKKLVAAQSLNLGVSTSCGCYQSDRMRHLRLNHPITVTPEVIQQRLNETCPCKYCGKHIWVWRWVLNGLGKPVLRRRGHRLKEKDGLFCGNVCSGTYYENFRVYNDVDLYTHKKIYAFGQSKSIKGWREDYRCVVSYNLLKKRLDLGWDPESAITTISNRKISSEKVVRSLSTSQSIGEAKNLMQGLISQISQLAS